MPHMKPILWTIILMNMSCNLMIMMTITYQMTLNYKKTIKMKNDKKHILVL